MRQGAAGRRRRGRAYLHAVSAAAQREGSWEAWEHDLAALRAIGEDDRVRVFLESAVVPVAERLSLVDRVADASIGARGRGLLRILMEQRDLDVVSEVERGFLRIADRERRLDRVLVTTAVPLNDAETDELRERLVHPGRKIHLTTATDPAIIGGIVVRRGDNLLDLSVRARLQSLGRALQ